MKKVVPLPDDEKILDLFKKWRIDPLKFVLEVFDWEKVSLIVNGMIVKSPSRQQQEALVWISKLAQAKLKRAEGQKLTAEETKLANKLGISIRSGHGCGKDRKSVV